MTMPSPLTLLVLSGFVIFEFLMWLYCWRAANRAGQEMLENAAEAKELAAACKSGHVDLAFDEAELSLVGSLARSASIARRPFSIAEVDDIVDANFGEQLDRARSGVGRLPILGLLGTFVGMGFALLTSASAHTALQSSLNVAPAALEVSGVTPTPLGSGEANFRAEALAIRKQLSGRLDDSLGGLRSYVDQQQHSLVGMGVAVAASVAGIIFSLLLQWRLGSLERSRRRFAADVLRLSEEITLAHRSSSLARDEASVEELLRILLEKLHDLGDSVAGMQDQARQSAAAASSAVQVVVPTTESLKEFIRELGKSVHEVSGHVAGMQDEARRSVIAASHAVNALLPTATVANEILRSLNKSVDEVSAELQVSSSAIASARNDLQSSTHELTNANRAVVSAAEATRSATTRLNAAGESLEATRDEVSQRMSELVSQNKSMLAPVEARLQGVEQAVRGVERSTAAVVVVRKQSHIGRLIQRFL